MGKRYRPLLACFVGYVAWYVLDRAGAPETGLAVAFLGWLYFIANDAATPGRRDG